MVGLSDTAATGARLGDGPAGFSCYILDVNLPFSTWAPMRKLILCALLLAACDKAETVAVGPESDLIGDWQASVTRTETPGTFTTVRYVLELGSDKKSVFEMFWNGIYAMGFEGGWALNGDDLDLTAIFCYKGDASGVQTRDECSGNMAVPTGNFQWDGRNISVSTDSTNLVFHKFENAMAAKAD